MPANVNLLGIETSYDVGSDPQYRTTIVVRTVADGLVHVATAGCSGDPVDCPAEIANENEWEFVEP